MENQNKIFTEEGQGSGYSVWFCVREDKSSSDLQEIVKNGGGPVFIPHITLLSYPQYSIDQANALKKKVEGLVETLSLFECTISKFKV